MQLSAKILIILSVYMKFKDVLAKPPSKIVGGNLTSIEKYPSIVSIHYNMAHKCGGSLISNKHILTAAHCVVEQPEGWTTFLRIKPEYLIEIYMGSDSNARRQIPRKVSKIHVHPNFTGDATNNRIHDIAILELKQTVEESIFQKPIALPSKNYVTGTISHVVGWGSKYENGPILETLREAVMKLVDNKLCRRGQLCAYNKPGVGFCDGDSGGPLIANNELIGIISWSINCAAGHPDIYTKVYEYLDWIHGIIDSFPSVHQVK